ncbi:NUDIX domain-containing protein [Halobacillus litoralis]|uniref:NUDIX hydrolase n=1 Tax=Halobacillus litoralis TaxID=45668 RepID=UPI001CD36763|nr:NUDIX domain-containing protein [Halobacillus litoralis]MCA0972552.1 NUDIX domain-containing protein [Halobacillus litoralis]
MREQLTIFNDQLEPTGTKERECVHKDGDWHETFHCWLYGCEGESAYLYFQKRADFKKEFPSLFDITAAGHIEAEEKVMEAGLREVEEEIGLRLSPSQLEYIGAYKEELETNEGMDREICRIYVGEVEDSVKLETSEEVTDLVKVKVEDLEKIFDGSITYQSIVTGNTGQIGHQDIVPHEKGYYEFVFRQIAEKVEKL